MRKGSSDTKCLKVKFEMNGLTGCLRWWREKPRPHFWPGSVLHLTHQECSQDNVSPLQSDESFFFCPFRRSRNPSCLHYLWCTACRASWETQRQRQTSCAHPRRAQKVNCSAGCIWYWSWRNFHPGCRKYSAERRSTIAQMICGLLFWNFCYILHKRGSSGTPQPWEFVGLRHLFFFFFFFGRLNGSHRTAVANHKTLVK